MWCSRGPPEVMRLIGEAGGEGGEAGAVLVGDVRHRREEAERLRGVPQPLPVRAAREQFVEPFVEPFVQSFAELPPFGRGW